MGVRSWAAGFAAIAAVCLLSSVSIAKPHDDSTHRAAQPIILTLLDGSHRTAILRGVGCTEAMCSRVRAQDDRADSIWLDGLASVRQIAGEASGALHVVLGFKDGTERAASIRETNRILYLTDSRGRSRTVDLGNLAQLDFD